MVTTSPYPTLPLRSQPSPVGVVHVMAAALAIGALFFVLCPVRTAASPGALVLGVSAFLVGAVSVRRVGLTLVGAWAVVAVGAAAQVRLVPDGVGRTLAVVAVAAVVLVVADRVTGRVTQQVPTPAQSRLVLCVGALAAVLMLRLAPGVLGGRWASGTLGLPLVGTIQVGEFTRPVLITAFAVGLDALVRASVLGRWTTMTTRLAVAGALLIGVHMAVLLVFDSGPAFLTVVAVIVVVSRYTRSLRVALMRTQQAAHAISGALGLLGVVVVVGAVAAWQAGAVARWAARFDQLSEPQFQTALALEASRRGGLVGSGFGSVSLAERVPVAGTDMLASVLAGELGALPLALLVACVLTVFSVLLRGLRGARVTAAISAHTGLVVALGVQLIVAVLGALGLGLLTGISAPLLVVGGSSLIPVAWVLGGALGAAQGMPVAREYRLSPAAVAVGAGVLAGLLVLTVSPPMALGRAYAELSAPRGALLTRDGEVIAAASDGSTREYPAGATFADLGVLHPRSSASGVESTLAHDLTCGGLLSGWEQAGALLHPAPCTPADVVMTLDAGLQGAGIETLRDSPGSFVVMDSWTGDILAMYGAETNPDAGDVSGKSQARLSQWEPASTLKPFVAYAALTSDSWPTDAPRTVLTVDGETLRNMGGSTCPSSTLQDALAYSCNTVLGATGVRIGRDALDKVLSEDFGGASTSFDGGDLASLTTGLTDDSTPAQVARTSIGQEGVRTSPLTLTAMYSALAYAAAGNDGPAPAPHILAAVCSGDDTVRRNETVTWGADLDEAAAALVLEAMAGATRYGTLDDTVGHAGTVHGRNVAGKSGTAQSTVTPSGTLWWTVVVVDARWVVTVAIGDRPDGVASSVNPAAHVAAVLLASVPTASEPGEC